MVRSRPGSKRNLIAAAIGMPVLAVLISFAVAPDAAVGWLAQCRNTLAHCMPAGQQLLGIEQQAVASPEHAPRHHAPGPPTEPDQTASPDAAASEGISHTTELSQQIDSSQRHSSQAAGQATQADAAQIKSAQATQAERTGTGAHAARQDGSKTVQHNHEQVDSKQAAPPAAQTGWWMGEDLPAGQVSVAAQGTPGLDDPESCHLKGTVDACCNCTYVAVDEVNAKITFPILRELARTPFFRYFKVNLWCDCPLWPDDSMCALRACSVCECEPHEVPQPWLAAESKAAQCSGSRPAEDAGAGAGPRGDDCNSALCAAESDGHVDRGVEPAMAAALAHLKGWRGHDNPWMAPHEGEDEEGYSYINLLANPERYTGYAGEHAHRIWSAIYGQSCFSDPALAHCEEQRVFFRLISGMHASISAHIAAKYLIDEGRGLWGPSMEQFAARLGQHEVRYRVANLYFSYLFVLRAVLKAGTLLSRFEYHTGLPEEDARTAALVKELVSREELHHACPMPFDEGRLWKGEQGAELLGVMQATFRNITRIMDCVGCEKCKLWGKLQTLGIATALKVLFSSSDCTGSTPTAASPFGTLTLERNEVIAMVNLLERFSMSLMYYSEMSSKMAAHDRAVEGGDIVS